MRLWNGPSSRAILRAAYRTSVWLRVTICISLPKRNGSCPLCGMVIMIFQRFLRPLIKGHHSPVSVDEVEMTKTLETLYDVLGDIFNAF
jgi:hypothetical protein